jgi:hypothetical protein
MGLAIPGLYKSARELPALQNAQEESPSRDVLTPHTGQSGAQRLYESEDIPAAPPRIGCAAILFRRSQRSEIRGGAAKTSRREACSPAPLCPGVRGWSDL